MTQESFNIMMVIKGNYNYPTNSFDDAVKAIRRWQSNYSGCNMFRYFRDDYYSIFDIVKRSFIDIVTDKNFNSLPVLNNMFEIMRQIIDFDEMGKVKFEKYLDRTITVRNIMSMIFSTMNMIQVRDVSISEDCRVNLINGFTKEMVDTFDEIKNSDSFKKTAEEMISEANAIFQGQDI